MAVNLNELENVDIDGLLDEIDHNEQLSAIGIPSVTNSAYIEQQQLESDKTPTELAAMTMVQAVNKMVNATNSMIKNTNMLMQQLVKQKQSDTQNEKKDDTQTDEKDIRSKWKVESIAEIFSQSKQQWFQGKIIKIFNDDEGEWLTIQYKQSVREISRYHSDIRPISSDDTNNNTTDTKNANKLSIKAKRSTRSSVQYNGNDINILQLNKQKYETKQDDTQNVMAEAPVVLETVQYQGFNYKWDGTLHPAFWKPEKAQWLRDHYEANANEIFIATFAKNGTTLMQHLCHYIMHCCYNKTKDTSQNHAFYGELQNKQYLVQNGWIERVKSDPDNQNKNNEFFDKLVKDTEHSIRLWKTHAPLELFPCKQLPSKMIIVCRNPKDVAASLYHHQCNRPEMNYTDDFSSFFVLFIAGLVEDGSYFEWYRKYWKLYEANLKEKKIEMLWLYYEDMVISDESKKAQIRKIVRFLGVDDVVNDNDDVNEILNATSVKTMRSHYQNFPIKNFVRKGIIGDWKTHFNAKQSEIIDTLITVHFNGTNFKYFKDLMDKKEYLCMADV